jgi:hypothetical protein
MDAEKFQLKNVSRFGGLKPKKTSSVFMRCQGALPAFDHGMIKKGYFQLHQI